MKYIIILTTLILAYMVYDSNNIKKSNIYSELTIDNEPFQDSTNKPPFYINKYKVTPLRKYKIQARILSKKEYNNDDPADFNMNFDLALGWKEMSDLNNLEKISISQRNRWYYWKTPEFFISREQIEHNSSNHHIIHSSDRMYDELDNLDENQIIEMEGYLVKVEDENAKKTWVSSLTREDTRGGACEIFYVERLIIK